MLPKVLQIFLNMMRVTWTFSVKPCTEGAIVAGRLWTALYCIKSSLRASENRKWKRKNSLRWFFINCHTHTVRKDIHTHMGSHVLTYRMRTYVNTHTPKHTQLPSESQTPFIAIWQRTASARGHERRGQMALSAACSACKTISALNEDCEAAERHHLTAPRPALYRTEEQLKMIPQLRFI